MFRMEIVRVTGLYQKSIFQAIRGRKIRNPISINTVPKNIITTLIKCIDSKEKSKNRDGPINNCRTNDVTVNMIPAPAVYFHVDFVVVTSDSVCRIRE